MKEAPHPGEILYKQFLKPLNMTQFKLAEKTGVSVQRVNEIVNCKRGITPDTAIKFAEVFNNTPDYWMKLQTDYEIYLAHKEMQSE